MILYVLIRKKYIMLLIRKEFIYYLIKTNNKPLQIMVLFYTDWDMNLNNRYIIKKIDGHDIRMKTCYLNMLKNKFIKIKKLIIIQFVL